MSSDTSVPGHDHAGRTRAPREDGSVRTATSRAAQSTRRARHRIGCAESHRDHDLTVRPPAGRHRLSRARPCAPAVPRSIRDGARRWSPCSSSTRTCFAHLGERDGAAEGDQPEHRARSASAVQRIIAVHPEPAPVSRSADAAHRGPALAGAHDVDDGSRIRGAHRRCDAVKRTTRRSESIRASRGITPDVADPLRIVDRNGADRMRCEHDTRRRAAHPSPENQP